jgi:hypothetical protein
MPVKRNTTLTHTTPPPPPTTTHMLKRAVALNALLIAVCGFLLYTAEIEDEPAPPNRIATADWLLRNEE